MNVTRRSLAAKLIVVQEFAMSIKLLRTHTRLFQRRPWKSQKGRRNKKRELHSFCQPEHFSELDRLSAKLPSTATSGAGTATSTTTI